MSSQLAMGMYTCSWNRLLVCTTLMWGKYESLMTWTSSWNVLVIMAWDATMAARMARTRLRRRRRVSTAQSMGREPVTMPRT